MPGLVLVLVESPGGCGQDAVGMPASAQGDEGRGRYAVVGGGSDLRCF
ncbi:hypothetical protein Ae406Ps2_6191c [Pseudonocardia sp. Ae406_Ps2]|nr:hypothetical protein Ae406Ps2_6191c [Pseudonocardia sp. Ae406_Ps2]